MRESLYLLLTTSLAILLIVPPALAGPTASQKCEAGKNGAAGKYAACLHKAQQKFVGGGELDPAGRDAAVLACGTKYSGSWTKLEGSAGAGVCPSEGDETGIQDFLDACILSAEGALGGGVLPTDVVSCNTALGTCNGDLGTCSSSLATCSGNLSTTNADLTECDADLSTANASLASCSNDLSSTNADLSACHADLSSTNADLSVCDANLSSTNADLGTCNTNLSATNADLGNCHSDLSATNADLGTCNSNLSSTNADLGACNADLGTCNSDLSSTNADLGTCNSDLSATNADLGACNSDLSATNADLGACNSDLSSTNADLGTCNSDLSATNADLGTCNSDLSSTNADLGTCNTDLSTCQGALATCVAAPAARILKSGQTTCYDSSGSVIPCAGTGHDGDVQAGVARSFTDNGDGTITDNKTGLMWEKQSDDGSVHDVDNNYSWADAVASKIAALNSGGFAGHTDWRVPNEFELYSLLSLGATNPSTVSAFNSGCAPTCTVMTCNCTRPGYYWSSSTYEGFTSSAWFVHFLGGATSADPKSNLYGVRAVRTAA